MGFTFSHPALILPFRYFPRRLYSLNGIVIGSMIPDLEYFMRVDNTSTFSHSLWGIFLFDIPASLLVLTMYHLIVRETAIKNLPPFLKSRMIHFLPFDWITYLKKNWIVVIYSIILGTLTHIVWDNFTSATGFFVKHFQMMETPVSVFQIEMSVYKIVKHSSSLLGILILLFFFFRLPQQKDHTQGLQEKHYHFWLITCALTIVFILLQIFQLPSSISVNGIIKKMLSCGLLATLIVSFFYKLKELKKQKISSN